ncbi:putative beta-lysine N-acetyltransferase [Rossellomorea aquimaris]|uniref:putative beta-lysine N-acetyltransferase n=1 Tax=Rossellomorea aquimaris TaxID=189382 RepID=UPI001CD4FF9B|nr:putative beta-lysine N-acetyltransferase [Rossellomorea aquimaris]MCA1054530.1 putative beta-lysine N-acetyltransferase [Rossellomorea aquimaris]
MQKYDVIKRSKLTASIYRDGLNKRIRVDDVRGDLTTLLGLLHDECLSSPYEKLIIKARDSQLLQLLENGYVHEGKIQYYFNGDCTHFMSKYLKDERRASKFWSKEDAILASVQKQMVNPHLKAGEHEIHLAGLNDVEGLAHLYKEVFQLYPVPLHDPAYIRDAMRNGTIFVCITGEEGIISAASAEIDHKNHNAEMTDCATLPQHRKGGFMKHLILKLEEELLERDIYCAYTIARALSYGMNAVFHQLGYQYRGRLANNCYIHDKMEDMNIWEKNLAQ